MEQGRWNIIKSRTDRGADFLEEMERRGWMLKSALYSCMDGMYHYIFRRTDDEQR